MESPGTQIVKTILKRENKVGGLTPPDFEIYNKATVIKIVYNTDIRRDF